MRKVIVTAAFLAFGSGLPFAALVSPAYAANDLIKCKLVDTGDGSTDDLTFEVTLNSRGPDGPGGSMLDEGPMLLERQREIGEPHRWLGYAYKASRIDSLGIVAVTDYHWGDEKEFDGSAFFYFDKRTGHAQLIELMGADKKPDIETGTCQQMPQ